MTAKAEIQITFTKEQLTDFLDIVCLGEWMINATRVDRIKKYDELAQHIFKAAGEAGLKGVEYDAQDKSYWLTREYEDSVLQRFKDEYDNEMFWDELSDRLAGRDLEMKFGRKELEVRFSEHDRHRLGANPATVSDQYPPASRSNVRQCLGPMSATLSG